MSCDQENREVKSVKCLIDWLILISVLVSKFTGQGWLYVKDPTFIPNKKIFVNVLSKGEVEESNQLPLYFCSLQPGKKVLTISYLKLN